MKKQKKTNTIQQVGLFILDKSGSMGTIKKDVISGFEEYLNEIKKTKVDLKFNLVLFDSISIDKPYVMKPLEEVQPLNGNTYVPDGMTPLYDSAVEAIKELEAKVSMLEGDTAVSVVIMTDGMENASKRYNEQDLRELIKRLEKEKNWTFAYMGANQDSYAVSHKIGISVGNTINWSSLEPQMAFASVALASANNMRKVADAAFRGMDSMSMDLGDFFDDKK